MTPRKDDAGKVQMRLLPWAALREVARVMTWAVTAKAPEPYPVGNWKGVAVERYEDAAVRHLAAHMEGERDDPESGLSHLAHAAFCVLFLLWQQAREGEPSHG